MSVPLARSLLMRRGVARSALRCFSTAEEGTKFDIGTTFLTHNIEAPPQHAYATSEELLKYHREMYTMRRMEISADMEYKARLIRGFCHLYDGQEAVASGVEASLTKDDDWITTYRCHCAAYVRGVTVQQILEECFGYAGGNVRGKGGSMHMYSKANNFYGGAAIVGAQVPVGAGLGFFHKYNRKGEEKTPVSLLMYGDGSANQGQCWEAANMAALWKIPVIFVCENNMYGMGTSIERHSSLTEYYKQGNFIPGIQVDGMDVLAVREAVRFAKEYASSGNGPIYMEMKTYRYHGHSMSDPGVTYRTRDEVSQVRASRDPIEMLKGRITEAGFATTEELKATEKEVRGEVADALKRAKDGHLPDPQELTTDIYTDGVHMDIPLDPGMSKRYRSVYPKEIRMPDVTKTEFH